MGARRPRSASPPTPNEDAPNVQWLVLNIKGGLTKSPRPVTPARSRQTSSISSVQSRATARRSKGPRAPFPTRAQAQALALAQGTRHNHWREWLAQAQAYKLKGRKPSSDGRTTNHRAGTGQPTGPCDQVNRGWPKERSPAEQQRSLLLAKSMRQQCGGFRCPTNSRADKHAILQQRHLIQDRHHEPPTPRLSACLGPVPNSEIIMLK